MAKFGSKSVVITLTDAPGGTARTITPYVREIGGIKVESITEETNGFGTTAKVNAAVGMQTVGDITLSGHYDNAATVGPEAVMGVPDDDPSDTPRVFTFTPNSGTKTFTMNVVLVSWSVEAQNNGLSKFSAVIRQAGAGAWA